MAEEPVAVGSPRYRWIPSPHFYPRSDRAITAIVIHYTAGMSIDGTIAWFRNRASEVSAHYIIGRDGEVVQMVEDHDIAWHAGRYAVLGGSSGVNAMSIGIELVGTDGTEFTAAQLDALWTLLGVLVAKYRIDPEHVVGHRDVLPGTKIDPDGTTHQFPWATARDVARAALLADTSQGQERSR